LTLTWSYVEVRRGQPQRLLETFPGFVLHVFSAGSTKLPAQRAIRCRSCIAFDLRVAAV